MTDILRRLCTMSMALSMLAVFPAHAATRDIQKEEANRQLVVDFYERVFKKHDVDGGAKVLAADYKEHNPTIKDGKDAFVSFVNDLFKARPEAQIQIVRVAADGDLVWLHCHMTNGPNDRGIAVVDIFRVEKGKITEHWDVMQPVPETSLNRNSMF